MALKYKKINLLRNLPFYCEEIKSSKKNIKLLSKLPFFPKKSKKLTNKQLSEALPFPLKNPKKLKKYQILKSTARVSRREWAYKRYTETYNVEVVDRISLSDSLFLLKSSIVNLFKDLLKEKRVFEYNLMATTTLKLWNNATNTYDTKTVYFDSGPITVINQRFNLNKAYEILNHRLDIWPLWSGWIVDKIEDVKINIANCEPLARSSYIPLPPKLNNSMKGLINIKWCHIRFINPTNCHPKRINKQDKK